MWILYLAGNCLHIQSGCHYRKLIDHISVHLRKQRCRSTKNRLLHYKRNRYQHWCKLHILVSFHYRKPHSMLWSDLRKLKCRLKPIQLFSCRWSQHQEHNCWNNQWYFHYRIIKFHQLFHHRKFVLKYFSSKLVIIHKLLINFFLRKFSCPF